MIVTPSQAMHAVALFKSKIEGLNLDKLGSAEDTESFFNSRFDDVFALIAPKLKVEIRFRDLSAITWRLHSELCVIDLTEDRCVFEFPHKWLMASDKHKLISLMKKVVPILPVIDEIAPISARKFLFEFGDNGYLPSVSYSSKNNYCCLIYDYDFFASGGHDAFRTISLEQHIPWEDRIARFFWRGQSTGMRRKPAPAESQPNDFTWLQRLWLCIVAQQTRHRDVCDIGLSGIVQIDEGHLQDSIRNHRLVKNRVDKMEFARYRYIIDIDGNSNAWSGLFTALLTGGCVMKVTSERGFRQWYYNMLAAFENYVPISADFCDFDDAISWAACNDRRAADIGANGEALARSITLENAIRLSAKSLKTWISQEVIYLDNLV